MSDPSDEARRLCREAFPLAMAEDETEDDWEDHHEWLAEDGRACPTCEKFESALREAEEMGRQDGLMEAAGHCLAQAVKVRRYAVTENNVAKASRLYDDSEVLAMEADRLRALADEPRKEEP